jgi:DNA replication and repair protein RecF
MICKKIQYKDFRNIENAEIEFCDGVNIFYGNNAEGKTNALEGIYMFANGKSFRSSNDRDLISFSKDLSFVKMYFEDSVREHEMEMKLVRGNRKLCFRNGVNIKKLSDFVGYFRAVLFCP